MKKKRFHFSRAERKRVREAVHAAEAATSGEIVPWIVPACKGYRWVHGLLTIAGAALATLVLMAVSWSRLWDVNLFQTLRWQSVGAAAGFALALVPRVHRFFVPRAWLSEGARTRALASFVSANLTETRERNGVLIFVALFERRVEILADRGIHARAPERYWDERVAQIVAGVHRGQPIEALCDCIAEIGRLMAKEFPAPKDAEGRSRHENQLPDGLRED